MREQLDGALEDRVNAVADAETAASLGALETERAAHAEEIETLAERHRCDREGGIARSIIRLRES